MKRRKIYFRADADSNIGWGHYYRSKALCEMLSEDFDCRFFSNEEILDKLSGDEIVVLDNYHFDSAYQQSIRNLGCRLVCIDDLHDRHFVADAIINFGCGEASLYDAEPYTRYYLGLGYAMLRKPFREAAEASAREGWFVSFGGADTFSLTDRFVKILEDNGVRKIKAVRSGSRYTAEQIAAMMRSCEFALLSSSNTCLEALSCGCKVYAGWWVDNQKDFYAALCAKNLIQPMGYLPEADSIPDAVPAGADWTVQDPALKFRMIFLGFSYRFVNYTQLTAEESREVWETRNLEQIRCRMTNPQPFPLEGHLKFVERLKEDSSRLYFAIFDGSTLAGSYDFVNIVDGESAERGLYVSPEYQGRHIGTMMEYCLEGEIRRRGVRTLFASVLKDNVPSRKFHESLGYSKYGEDSENVLYRREL